MVFSAQDRLPANPLLADLPARVGLLFVFIVCPVAPHSRYRLALLIQRFSVYVTYPAYV